ncbi:MAG TPA: glycosyltransferase family 2 protein [Thermoanaerobaculia bacterium]|nr:glycosyltransferase family 2 protein [Thermoanaerobaculia bacterium]
MQPREDHPISIVIPTYNRLSTLRQVLDSYRAQRRVGEILIVDDAGTDGTGAFVRALQAKDPRIAYLRHPSRRGLPAARNMGIRQATGCYVMFGEDDLRLAPGYAETLLGCLERTGVSIIGGRALYPLPGETDEEALARVARPLPVRIDRRRLFYDTSAPAEDDLPAPFLHSWTLIRREVFDDVLYDEGYRGNFFREETDFYLRAGRAGHSLSFCPHTYCVHLPREGSIHGGCWADGIWRYKYWALRNNYRFLRRHHADLAAREIVSDRFSPLMLLFAATELQRALTYTVRRYFPRVYASLARRMLRETPNERTAIL